MTQNKVAPMINEATPGAANAVCHPPNVARTPVKTAAPARPRFPATPFTASALPVRPPKPMTKANPTG